MNGVTSKLLIAAVFALQAEQGLAQQPGSAAYNSVYLPAHGVGDTRRPVEERWGALALGKKDAVGWTLDGTNEEDAAGTALDACRASGDGCRVMLTFVNECAAIALSPTRYEWVKGNKSLRSLRRQVLGQCGEECFVVRDGCALPGR